MKKFLMVLAALMALSASVSAYIPTTNSIKHNTRASFVVINTEKRACKKYRSITVSKYFTLEDLINIEWRSLVFHRVACKYTLPKCVLANVMFVTEDNWKTITKQELYDLTFDFFKTNTVLYKDAEKRVLKK